MSNQEAFTLFPNTPGWRRVAPVLCNCDAGVALVLQHIAWEVVMQAGCCVQATARVLFSFATGCLGGGQADWLLRAGDCERDAVRLLLRHPGGQPAAGADHDFRASQPAGRPSFSGPARGICDASAPRPFHPSILRTAILRTVLCSLSHCCSADREPLHSSAALTA